MFALITIKILLFYNESKTKVVLMLQSAHLLVINMAVLLFGYGLALPKLMLRLFCDAIKVSEDH